MSNEVREAIGYRAVEPIGTRIVYGHISSTAGYRWGEIPVPRYPPSPEGDELRELRVSLDMSLREAADALGIRAAEVSALERGGATCAWGVAMAALHRASEAK